MLLLNIYRSVTKYSVKLNRKYIVDALGSLKREAAQDILVELVLKSPRPDTNLVDSVLIHAIRKGIAPSQVSITWN